MTEEQLKAIEELSERATKGPWIADEGHQYLESPWWGETTVILAEFQIPKWHEDRYKGSDEAFRNKQFTAQARTLVPELVAEVRRQQARIQELEEALGFYADFDTNADDSGVYGHREPVRINGIEIEWFVRDEGEVARKTLNEAQKEGENNG